MTPGIAFWRFGCSLLLGGCLGLWYGFLRPLGTKHRTLSDVFFSLGAVWCWVCICFGICRGDIRFVFLAAMLGGLFLWEATFGRWVRPVFSGFWQFFRGLFRLFLFPWKKFLEIAKILFASVKKWVTMKCTKICTSVQTRRKESHGKQKLPAQTSESGSSSCIQYP